MNPPQAQLDGGQYMLYVGQIPGELTEHQLATLVSYICPNVTLQRVRSSRFGFLHVSCLHRDLQHVVRLAKVLPKVPVLGKFLTVNISQNSLVALKQNQALPIEPASHFPAWQIPPLSTSLDTDERKFELTDDDFNQCPDLTGEDGSLELECFKTCIQYLHNHSLYTRPVVQLSSSSVSSPIETVPERVRDRSRSRSPTSHSRNSRSRSPPMARPDKQMASAMPDQVKASPMDVPTVDVAQNTQHVVVTEAKVLTEPPLTLEQRFNKVQKAFQVTPDQTKTSVKGIVDAQLDDYFGEVDVAMSEMVLKALLSDAKDSNALLTQFEPVFGPDTKSVFDKIFAGI